MCIIINSITNQYFNFFIDKLHLFILFCFPVDVFCSPIYNDWHYDIACYKSWKELSVFLV